MVVAQAGIANTAGGGAGASVTTAITFTDAYGNGKLPNSYSVQVTPSAIGVTAAVSGKTTSGFNVVLAPAIATATLAAGSFDLVVIG